MNARATRSRRARRSDAPDRRRIQRLQQHAELRVLRARDRRLSGARPVAKTGLRPGVVVWAHVPFAHGDGKLRPAVVTARRGHTLVVRPITSRPHRMSHPGYRALERWDEAGLARRSAVRLIDVPIALSDVVCIVGELHPEDLCKAFPPRAVGLEIPSQDHQTEGDA